MGCDILIDMFTGSKFDPIELEKEKDVIYEEIKMIEDSPEDDANDLLVEMVFRGTSLERPIIGNHSSLHAITRETILEFMKEEYTADSIVISVAGSFDEDHICDIFNGKLAGLKASKSRKVHPVHLYVPSYKQKIKDVEQAHICLGAKGVPHEDEYYFSMALLNSIMGGSMSSRLFQNIREQKGLAYSVYSGTHSYLTDGVFNIYAGVSNSKIDQVIEAIAFELQHLNKDGITEDELHIAKEQLKSSYVFSQENVNNRMYSNGKNTLLLSKLLTPPEIIEKINLVTMDCIRNTSERITYFEKYSGVLICNEEYNLENRMKDA
jgi:predicted Zn-dependent peptidase